MVRVNPDFWEAWKICFGDFLEALPRLCVTCPTWKYYGKGSPTSFQSVRNWQEMRLIKYALLEVLKLRNFPCNFLVVCFLSLSWRLSLGLVDFSVASIYFVLCGRALWGVFWRVFFG